MIIKNEYLYFIICFLFDLDIQFILSFAFIKMDSSIDFSITPITTTPNDISIDEKIENDDCVISEIDEEVEDEVEVEDVPKKRSSPRIASHKMRKNTKKSREISLKQPIIRALLKNGATRDQVDVKKKNRTLMKSTDFIPSSDNSTDNNVIQFKAPSQTRIGMQYNISLTYDYPNVAISCNCGQSYGIEKRSNCYHVQSVMNIVFENYFKQFVSDHRAASRKASSTSTSSVPDSRKRRRTSDMELDTDIRMERNSREEISGAADIVPDAEQEQEQNVDRPNVIHFLTQMMESFSIKSRAVRH
jgi:hypothetical protein